VDANTPTLGDFLRQYFSESDIATGVKRVEAAIDQVLCGLHRVLVWGCEMVQRLEKLPPSCGYEPMLVERGQDPLVARFFSYLYVGLAKDIANEAKMQPIVVEALRFLARPGRAKRAISRRAAALLEVWNTTSNLGNAFSGVDVSVFEFVESLEAVADGDYVASQRVTEIAGVLAPRLAVPRGRKASAASIAHEFWLSDMGKLTGQMSYTWDEARGDFTDPLTRATRLAFGDPDFDPRPAFRRQKARLRQQSNRTDGRGGCARVPGGRVREKTQLVHLAL
jgi:hypothetical protein